MKSLVILDEAPSTPAPFHLVAKAEALVKKYHSDCFWFWGPSAKIKSLEDVELVVRQLREYGNHGAWKEAQELHKCL